MPSDEYYTACGLEDFRWEQRLDRDKRTINVDGLRIRVSGEGDVERVDLDDDER